MKKTMTPLFFIVWFLVPLSNIALASSLSCKTDALALNDPLQQLFLNKGKLNTQWLGGDNANSMSIGHGQYVWTFGDTLLGTFPDKKNTHKNYRYFIHDSIGKMNFSSEKPTMQFYFNESSEGKPTTFFKPQNKAHYYWLLSGVSIGDKVVLGLAEIENKAHSFDVVGTSYAVVDNPEAAPGDWVSHLFNLTTSFPKALAKYQWNVALVKNDDYLYLFGAASNVFKYPSMYLARIKKEDAFNNQWQKLSFFTERDSTYSEWKSIPFNYDGLKQVQGLPAMSEASFFYDKKTTRWYTLSIPFGKMSVFLYSAKQLTGPWTNHGSIYHIPAPWSTEKEKGKSLFISYAPKFHPELSTGQGKGMKVMFSYINNLNTFELPGIWSKKGHAVVKEYTNFYIPLLVKVQCQ